MSTIVVDYGIGNVFSVCNAVRRAGGDVELTGDLRRIRQADRVILPGVGAFARAIEALNSKGISFALTDFIATGKPFLGVCVGMQLLMDRSTEFGSHKGLGFISGEVVRIPDVSPSGSRLRVPHIGWAPLQPAAPSGHDWSKTPLHRYRDDGGAVYFVHSYHCMPIDPTHRLAFADYDGAEITAAIGRDNIMGVQFHPERSGEVGHQILRNFIDL